MLPLKKIHFYRVEFSTHFFRQVLTLNCIYDYIELTFFAGKFIAKIPSKSWLDNEPFYQTDRPAGLLLSLNAAGMFGVKLLAILPSNSRPQCFTSVKRNTIYYPLIRCLWKFDTKNIVSGCSKLMVEWTGIVLPILSVTSKTIIHEKCQ